MKKQKQKKHVVAKPIKENITHSAGASSDYWKRWIPLFCAIIAGLLYLNTVNHDYVLDDEMVTFKNKIVTKGISAIPEIFTTAYREGFWDRKESLYRPLSLVMFAVEDQLAPSDPMLSHIVNILLYAFTGWLVYILFTKWMNRLHPLIPIAAALIFITHPIHTEVVANIKSRDEMLGLCFGVAAFVFFYDYVKENNIRKLILGAFCFFLSVLAKESAITLFVALPLSLYFFTNAKKSHYGMAIASLSVFVFIYFGLRILALGEISNFNEIALVNNSIVGAKSPVEHISTSLVMIGTYIQLFLFPHPLSYDYSYNTIPISSLSDIRTWMSLAVIIGMLIYVIKNIKSKNAAAFGFLFFGITISIVSNMVIVIEATLGERFAYFPSIGLSIALPILISKIFPLKNKEDISLNSLIKNNLSFVVIIGISLALFSFKTVSRNAAWKTSFDLFTADKDNNPNSARTQFAYASELIFKKIIPLEDGDPLKITLSNEALEYLNKSLKIMPDYFDARFHVVLAYRQLKDYPNALKAYETALKYKNRENVDFYIQGALTYADLRLFEKAIECNKQALAIEKISSEVWNNLGMCYTEIGARKEGWDALNQSLQIDSSAANTWYNLGNWYAKGGEYMKAVDTYKKTLSRDPNHVGSLNNSGNCYAATQQYNMAIQYYERTLSIQPNNAEAIQNIGITYNILGQPDKANEYLSRLRR
jgi:tetratricopeptide (TPR) repeat protein